VSLAVIVAIFNNLNNCTFFCSKRLPFGLTQAELQGKVAPEFRGLMGVFNVLF